MNHECMADVLLFLCRREFGHADRHDAVLGDLVVSWG